MGGHVLQYQIKVNPAALNKFHLTLDDVITAMTSNNRNAGGQFLVVGSEEYLVRGIGLIDKLEDLRNVQVKSINGIPIRISDVAGVDFGKEIRRGVVTRNGTEEVVAGIVMKLYGQNTSDIIKRLDKKIPEVQRSLPAGVKLVPYYNQSSLVKNALKTVQDALWQGGILVIAILALFRQYPKLIHRCSGTSHLCPGCSLCMGAAGCRRT